MGVVARTRLHFHQRPAVLRISMIGKVLEHVTGAGFLTAGAGLRQRIGRTREDDWFCALQGDDHSSNPLPCANQLILFDF